tara:strand:- start:213 stop:590 length:378 start_codon:yes stop_codon:yes gene_type:complete
MIVSSCSSYNCFDLTYDKINRLTYHSNKLFTGDCKSYYLTKNLKSDQSYTNGKDDGLWTFYFPNGKIQTKGTFNSGLRVGKWEYFHDNGLIFKENFYDMKGLKTGIWKTYDKNGKLISENKIYLD